MGADAAAPDRCRFPIGSVYVPTPRRLEPELPSPVIVRPPPPPTPIRQSSKAARVIRLARQLGGLDAQALQDSMGLSRGAAQQMLSRLTASGHLVREEVGRYTIAKDDGH